MNLQGFKNTFIALNLPVPADLTEEFYENSKNTLKLIEFFGI